MASRIIIGGPKRIRNRTLTCGRQRPLYLRTYCPSAAGRTLSPASCLRGRALLHLPLQRAAVDFLPVSGDEARFENFFVRLQHRKSVAFLFEHRAPVGWI